MLKFISLAVLPCHYGIGEDKKHDGGVDWDEDNNNDDENENVD